MKMELRAISEKSWWTRRSNLERGLIGITAVALILCILLAVWLICISNAKNDVCETPGCIQAASDLLNSMDTSVDPCEDFFEFACGNYLKNTQIPEDLSSVNPFTDVYLLLQKQLRTALEEPINYSETKPTRMVKMYYQSCTNTEIIEKQGTKIATDIIKDLGGWPVLEGNQWNESEFDWIETMYRLRKTGLNFIPFLSVHVYADFKNSSVRRVHIDAPCLGLGRKFLLKGMSEDSVKALYEFMVDVAVYFGANKESASKEMREVIEFLTRLSYFTVPDEEARNMTKFYNPMTINQLQNKWPSFPWLKYINNLLYPTAQITYADSIGISEPDYISGLIDLMGKTPKRVQANYAMWKSLQILMQYMPEEVDELDRKFSKEISGVKENPPRWRQCVSAASGKFPYLVASLYIRKYFSKDSKTDVAEMVNNIQNVFINVLNKIEWMDEKTKANALEKVNAMVYHVAYPDELLDDKKLDDFYEKLEIYPDQYLKSALNMRVFSTNFNFKRLREEVNKTDWISRGNVANVNAYNDFSENSITIFAGILQGIFYDKDRPQYLNYGAIGSIIGHEITHGFDDMGKQFDKSGNLVDWWEPETEKAFTEKAQCFIDQYGNYTIEEIDESLNGINNQGENIADNGGVKEAYTAYKNWVKTNGREQKLPGLDYSANQLFWIANARTKCGKYRNETLKWFTEMQHSPDRFRVIGPLSNSEDFANDFKCSVGSPMNPVSKCTIW